MLPFTSISMDHIRNSDGLPFTTESNGIGDIKLAGTEPVRNFVLMSHTLSRKGRSKYGKEAQYGD